jgi:hypothetical protein
MPIMVVDLAFDLCVVYYRSRVLKLSLITENWENTSKEELVGIIYPS